jgi:hypothetical protein
MINDGKSMNGRLFQRNIFRDRPSQEEALQKKVSIFRNLRATWLN